MAELTPKQLLAVAAVLEHGSAAKAADAAGVSLRTLTRWQSSPVFRLAARDAAAQALDSTVRRLGAATSRALDTLLAALQSQESESLRVRAAGLILDYALKADAAELRERIEALEEAHAKHDCHAS